MALLDLVLTISDFLEMSVFSINASFNT